MKDLPHHMKKLNRRIVRSEHRLESEDQDYASHLPNIPQPTSRPKSQLRKQAKQRMKKATNARVPDPLTPEERNRKMQKRAPVFDRYKAVKAGARPTKKKTPRI
jgi:hypothetical protein